MSDSPLETLRSPSCRVRNQVRPRPGVSATAPGTLAGKPGLSSAGADHEPCAAELAHSEGGVRTKTLVSVALVFWGRNTVAKQDTVVSQKSGSSALCYEGSSVTGRVAALACVPSERSQLLGSLSPLETCSTLPPNSVSSPTITIATHILWHAWGHYQIS